MKKIITTGIFLMLMSISVIAQYTDADAPGSIKNDSTSQSVISQVINEDLYVIGSIGLGFDMYGTYPFGFSTMAMLENNLRIRFDDTSNSADFPDNDWEITINDSENGGDDYFRISDITFGQAPFTIQSNAGNNALFVERGSGHVGLGNADPARDLHLTSGDTPGIRLEQNQTVGYPAQTWDVFGNEANFMISDVTNGSAYCFRIQPGTPTNTLTLRSGGNVGIGTWSPQHTLEVVGDMQVNSYFYFGDESTDGNWRVSVVAEKLTFEKREAGVWVSKIEMD